MKMLKPATCFLTLGLIGLLNFTSTAQDFITNGLVAYYPFNENVNDYEGTNNGVIHGGVALAPDRFGNPNSAYQCNGVDGYIDIGNPVGNSPTNLTECAWVKIVSRATSGYGLNDVIMTKRQDPSGLDPAYWPTLFVSPGGNGVLAVDGPFYENDCTSITQTPINVWVFLCGVVSNGTYQIYINGTLENTITDGTTLNSPYNIYLMHDVSWGTFCNGVIDDVRIYNRALSSNEVAQLFELEEPAPKITSPPTNIVVNIGDTASFNATATGVAPLNYQWLKDGIALPNATNATLLITNTQPSRIGNYTVTISDQNASITSNPASLSISNVNSALWQGLVAYYPFNGNANDYEGTNNGVIYGGVALAPDRFGSNNSAYFFNGVDGYIDIGNPVGNSPVYLTEVAWVKTSSIQSAPGVPSLDAIITKRQNGSDESSWPTLGINTGGSSAGTGTIAVDAPFYYDPCIGTTLTPTNVWVCLCGVVSNGTYQIYVNGSLENTISDSYAFGSESNMFLMHSGAWNEYCNGVLDDVRIYNRALSPSDVLQLYASEAPPSPPRTARATAEWAGAIIVGVDIVDGGAGYTNMPNVRFIGGGGTGARASAVITNGVIVAINILNSGSGYTNTPIVVIDPPFISNPVLGIASISMLNFSNLLVGTNYQLQQFQSTTWVNQSASFTATNSSYMTMVSGVVGSGDYRLAQIPVPVQATAVAQVVNGFVVNVSVRNPGSGYIIVPAVAIIANVGSNATAVASISNGRVTSITVTSAGIHYVNPVMVQIDPPPATALSPVVISGVVINSSGLAPYDNYQIQFKTDMGAAWENLNGGLFYPTNEQNAQYIFLTNTTGYFQLEYLP
jgi:Concanavalin A-like lectin/glucanases superfamily/Immunoglobulin domain